jgi:arylformamidase
MFTPRAGYEIVDLSLKLPEAGIAFPGDTPLSIRGPASHVPGAVREFCYELTMSTQAGTHIQGAHYFEEEGRRIDEYPLSRFEAPIHVLDCTDSRTITREFLAARLPLQNLADVALLFRTGFIWRLLEIWKERRLTFDDLNGKPGLTLEAAELLVERNAKLLGIDSTGFEIYPSETHPVNRLFSRNDVLLLENLCGLERLPQEGAWLECFPLPIEGVEGTPCRAIARIPKL